MSATLLVARKARIAVDDAVAISSLDLETSGDRLVVLGQAQALVSALTGIPQGAGSAAQVAATHGELTRVTGHARAVSGELRLAGRDVVARAHLPWVGAAPLDPPMPQNWTAERYAVETVRLALAARADRSVSSGEIERRAIEALERAGLGAARKRPFGKLHLVERRAAVLAAASASAPDVVVAETPLLGLDAQGAQFIRGALDASCEGRKSIVTIAELTPGTAEGALARSATDLAAFVRGELSLFGTPAQCLDGRRVYRMTVRSNAAELRRALSERGASLEGGPSRFTLRLAADQDPTLVLCIASEVRSAVVEIVPVV